MNDQLTFLAFFILMPLGPMLLIANLFTLADVLSIAPHAWPAARISRKRWTLLAGSCVLLVPMGLVLAPLWRLSARPRLESAAPGCVRQSFKSGPSIFEAATTWYSRIFRIALVLLATTGLALGMPKLQHALVGDPSHVGITDLSQDIAPKPWIEQHCSTSVVRTLHLDSALLQQNGHEYQRWTVLPKPGHVDRVLLDLDSGKVVCP